MRFVCANPPFARGGTQPWLSSIGLSESAGLDSLRCTPCSLALLFLFFGGPRCGVPRLRVASASLPPPALRFHRPQAASTGYDPAGSCNSDVSIVGRLRVRRARRLFGLWVLVECARTGVGVTGGWAGDPPGSCICSCAGSMPGAPPGMIIPPGTPAAAPGSMQRARRATWKRSHSRSSRILSALAGPAGPAWRRRRTEPAPLLRSTVL